MYLRKLENKNGVTVTHFTSLDNGKIKQELN